MELNFVKYSATGNDFILIWDKEGNLVKVVEPHVKALCHRQHGIGADGLIVIKPLDAQNFQMTIFNCDGERADMCGNGVRASTHYFHNQTGEKSSEYIVQTPSGKYPVKITDNTVTIEMEHFAWNDNVDLSSLKSYRNKRFLSVGIPHLCLEVDDIDQVDVNSEGKKLRHDPLFSVGGTNVNFYSANGEKVFIRTFERGVEGETLCCGTGVTATALSLNPNLEDGEVNFQARGGVIKVLFKNKKVFYSGSVQQTFHGSVTLKN
ncbi:MAG: diaminopimelate epimerase [Halobacteriovoraceae bacterium]|nr:diaminopimelate epimerase [Halobacteriovoraceae bacterium]